MVLDRRSIEKKDFPVERRGYSSAAVDAHLSTLANEVDSLSGEVERLRRTSSARSSTASTLASAASEQVRSILEAAESSAAEIEGSAEEQARDIREQANSEAQAIRERSAHQAREQVGAVRTSTETMLERLRSMETELDSLRTGCERLSGELEQLESNLSEVAGAIATSFLLAAGRTTSAAPRLQSQPASTESEAAKPAPAEEDPVTDGEDEALARLGGDEAEGVRLIALNMALTGTPRAETARYLQENFSLSNADRLLDEVYASVHH